MGKPDWLIYILLTHWRGLRSGLDVSFRVESPMVTKVNALLSASLLSYSMKSIDLQANLDRSLIKNSFINFQFLE